MGKYTPPPVTLLDIWSALPRLRTPLMWQVQVRPAGAQAARVLPAVELCLVRPNGSVQVYRRWGRECRAEDTLAVFRTLLVAAQEAALWTEPIHPDDLMKLVVWNCDAPR